MEKNELKGERKIPVLTAEGERWFSSNGAAQVARGLSGGILHYLDNQLMVISGMTELAQEVQVDSAVIKDLETARSAVDKINEYLRRLAILNKICNRETYEFKEVPVSLLEFKPDISMGEVIVKQVQDKERDDTRILVDREKMNLIVQELIQNSIEAKARRILITFQHREESLEISIADDGEGMKITEDLLYNLGSSTKVVKGAQQISSFGLFMAKTFALAHGGEIQADLKGIEGKGSTVKIRIPLLQK